VNLDRANDLREAEVREQVAKCLEVCADRLAELGESFSPGELRDEAAFQRAEARDLRERVSG
jgi:hypothetical protein